jgi:TetR/AcrR family transcriptional regulator
MISDDTAADAGAGPPARKRSRDADATRRRLLAAAEAEFAAQGYQGARLREIAHAAGVQPALIHHYFDDKRGLYRAVIDAAMQESSALSWNLLEKEADFSSMVGRFVTMLLRFNYERRNFMTILRREGEGGSSASDVGREVMSRLISPVLDAVRSYLLERQRAGEIRADVAIDTLIVNAMALCSYPFMEVGFLEVCIPQGVIADDETLALRQNEITQLIVQFYGAGSD